MADAAPWGEYRYRVEAATAATPAVRELWLAPVDTALAYRAGQYVLLCDSAYRLPQRSYSIANAPRADGRISLLVTRFEGGPVSSWVHDTLAPGDEVLLEGPYGTFVAGADRTCPVLLLAAGSGLAPNQALLQELLARDPERQVTLFFSGRTAADAIGRAGFEDLGRSHARFRYLLTLTRDPTAPRHRRIPQLLAGELGNLCGWHVYIAGPSGFVTACAAAAREQGADAAAVHTEEFFADPQPWIDAPPIPPRPEAPR